LGIAALFAASGRDCASAWTRRSTSRTESERRAASRGERQLVLDLLERQQRAGVAGVDAAALSSSRTSRGSRSRRTRVGDRRALAAHATRDLLLGQVQLLL
jgi:hypothetical protein